MARENAQGDAVITGRGLVGALGLDVVTACAAARAGLLRISELDHFKLADPSGSAAGAPIKGHAVAGLTHGFSGEVRLLRLLEAGLRDFVRQTGDVPLEPSRARVFLSLPDPQRMLTGAARISHEPKRQELEKAAAARKREPIEPRARRLLERALALAGLPRWLDLGGVTTEGHTGVARMCLEAIGALHGGTLDLALVVGVDSLLDAGTLRWLDDTERLRTPTRPAGLIPGEACAVLLLEAPSGAKRRAARAPGTVVAGSVAHEPDNILSGNPARGAALAETIDAHRARAGWTDAMRPWVLSDHNGEIARASEWGNALVHLLQRSPLYQDVHVAYPAASFGDCGAASGAIAICMALAAWERGYAHGPAALVQGMADGSERVALLLEQAR